jgi:uncharacterized protein (TIGR02453 family)
LRELRANNDRTWFAEHRTAYDEVIKPGWHDFVAGLLIAAVPYEPRFAYVDPAACIFRIHRDVRFARDKAPYKTALSAFLSPRGWRGSTPGWYVALEPGGASRIAAGIYVPEKPALAALRARFAAGDATFERILRSKQIQPYLPLATDPLVRVPRGYDRDHPRAELLRARRVMVGRRFTDSELLRGDAFAIVRSAMRDVRALVAWLDACIGEASGDDGYHDRDE